MRDKLRYGTLCFAVLLCLQVAFSSSLSQAPQAESDTVVLKQEQLPAREQGEPLSNRIDAKSIDGTSVALDRLPAATNAKVEHMASRVVPRIDFSGIDPKEAIRFIVTKAKPKNMIRLGLVSDQEREPDPDWLDDLQLGRKKLSCTFTNASLLHLSVLLAESLDCEFGVDSRGEVVFRNKTQEARTEHPAYILKRKKAESKRKQVESN